MAVLVFSGGVTNLYDLSNRTLLSSYRDSSPPPRGVALISSPVSPCSAWPSHFVSAQAGGSSVYVYGYGSDAPLFRCALSEGLLSVAASGDGALVAGGGASGRAYLWDSATGELLREWQAHYKAVGALAFSPCDALLATGGQDGLAHCWDVAALLDGGSSGGGGGAPQPAATWAGHSMAVTSLCFSPLSGLFGGAAAARVVTCSADRTVRWWDVATRRCLRAVALPAGATCACPNADGSRWYVGGVDGVVYAVEGEGAGAGAAPRAFLGHTAAVTALCLAQDGRTLLSGGDDGSVRVWDAAAKTQVGSLGAPGAAVAALLLLPMRPPGLAGGGRAPHLPVRAVAPLRKHAGLYAAAAMGGGGGGGRVAVLRLLCGGGSGGAGEEEERAAEAAFAAAAAGQGAGAAAREGEGEGVAAGGSSAAEELAALKAQVETLKAENVRWKAAASRLLGGGVT
jgi:pre-rRNA-processing protein IPI3